MPLTLELTTSGLSVSQALELLTSGPARTLGLACGSLAVGAPADVCVFDPDVNWVLETDALLSSGKNTPFAGRRMRGRVTHTLVDGQLVYVAPECQEAV